MQNNVLHVISILDHSIVFYDMGDLFYQKRMKWQTNVLFVTMWGN